MRSWAGGAWARFFRFLRRQLFYSVTLNTKGPLWTLKKDGGLLSPMRTMTAQAGDDLIISWIDHPFTIRMAKLGMLGVASSAKFN